MKKEINKQMDTKNFTIDSSVFISAITPKDRFYVDSQKLFAWLHKNWHYIIIHLPFIVVFEVVNILRRRGLQKEAEFFIQYSRQDFLSVNPLDDLFFETWFDEIKDLSLDIKTNDSIVIMTAYITNSVLITTDVKITKQGKKIISVFSPKEILPKLV